MEDEDMETNGRQGFDCYERQQKKRASTLKNTSGEATEMWRNGWPPLLKGIRAYDREDVYEYMGEIQGIWGSVGGIGDGDKDHDWMGEASQVGIVAGNKMVGQNVTNALTYVKGGMERRFASQGVIFSRAYYLFSAKDRELNHATLDEEVIYRFSANSKSYEVLPLSLSGIHLRNSLSIIFSSVVSGKWQVSAFWVSFKLGAEGVFVSAPERLSDPSSTCTSLKTLELVLFFGLSTTYHLLKMLIQMLPKKLGHLIYPWPCGIETKLFYFDFQNPVITLVFFYVGLNLVANELRIHVHPDEEPPHLLIESGDIEFGMTGRDRFIRTGQVDGLPRRRKVELDDKTPGLKDDRLIDIQDSTMDIVYGIETCEKDCELLRFEDCAEAPVRKQNDWNMKICHQSAYQLRSPPRPAPSCFRPASGFDSAAPCNTSPMRNDLYELQCRVGTHGQEN
ncbi:hypothetical protein Tco_0568857 [Tanacetum coccineum]